MVAFPELRPGLVGTLRHQVNDVSTARHLGSGAVDVLATPELVRWMEAAAVKALAEHLPSGFTTVGVALSVEHIAPTPVGLNVEVEAVLSEVQGRRLRFRVVARDDLEEVGRGTHERVLVEIGGFMAKANHKLV